MLICIRWCSLFCNLDYSYLFYCSSFNFYSLIINPSLFISSNSYSNFWVIPSILAVCSAKLYFSMTSLSKIRIFSALSCSYLLSSWICWSCCFSSSRSRLMLFLSVTKSVCICLLWFYKSLSWAESSLIVCSVSWEVASACCSLKCLLNSWYLLLRSVNYLWVWV